MIERRNWHWVDWMLLSVQTGWFLLGFIYWFSGEDPFGALPWWVGLTLMLLNCIGSLLFWRPYYVNLLWFPVAVLLTAGTLQLLIVAETRKLTGVIFIPLILVGFLHHRRTMWWTIPVFLFGYPLANEFIFHVHDGLSNTLEDFLNYVMFYGIGFALGKLHRTHVKTGRLLEENQRQYTLIQQQNKALELYAGRIETLTLQAERNRMARELHDTVGHTFTSVIMGMDAVAYLIEAAPEKARQQLEKLREVTRNGLEEVRRSIHEMAPDEDDSSLAEQLSRLSAEFAAQTGTTIHVTSSGTEYALPQQTKWTLFRCLQESLTNAKRHGEASVIEVTLLFAPHDVELRIHDNGIGSDELRSGFGLTAMRERLQELQGTLYVSSAAGQGTAVTCRVPFSA